VPDAHKNFAVSTVATAPSPVNSGTSLIVQSGHGARFPAVPFNMTVFPANAAPDPSNAEIVRVTDITTDTLTILRAQESTSARSVVVGDRVSAGITAQTLTDAEAGAWTTSTAFPVGGNDGNYHLRWDQDLPIASRLYRKQSGGWATIGTNHTHLIASLLSSGWGYRNQAYAAPNASSNDTSGAYLSRYVTGTIPGLSGNTIDFAGSSADSSWTRIFPSAAASFVLTGVFSVGTLPSGGTSMKFGCGNYWGVSFPGVTIDSSTRAITIDSTSTGITAQANDVFYITSNHGFGTVVISRNGAQIYSLTISGSLYSTSHAQDYGKMWFVGSTGTLTAGSVTLSQCSMVVSSF
jgi:hypothetical protein